MAPTGSTPQQNKAIKKCSGVRGTDICALPFKFAVAVPDAQEATTFDDTEIKTLEIIAAPECNFL